MAAFGSIQSIRAYAGGQVTRTTWHSKLNCALSLVQVYSSAEMGGWVGKQALHNSTNEEGLQVQ